MKTTIDGFGRAGSERETAARREWTASSISKVLLGAALLTLVYLLASSLPAQSEVHIGHLVRGFLFFWVLGGIFTVTLLALSDRRA
jgi:hypothetical protein